MQKDLPFYIALAATPGIGPARFKVLLQHFKSAEAVWRADAKILQNILTPKLYSQLI